MCLFHTAANEAGILFFFTFLYSVNWSFLKYCFLCVWKCQTSLLSLSKSPQDPSDHFQGASIRSTLVLLALVLAEFPSQPLMWTFVNRGDRASLAGPLPPCCRTIPFQGCHSLSSVTLITLRRSTWVVNLFGLLQFCGRFFWSIFLCFLLWPLKP